MVKHIIFYINSADYMRGFYVNLPFRLVIGDLIEPGLIINKGEEILRMRDVGDEKDFEKDVLFNCEKFIVSRVVITDEGELEAWIKKWEEPKDIHY